MGNSLHRKIAVEAVNALDPYIEPTSSRFDAKASCKVSDMK
jgi:hypothetical protein